MKFLLLGNQVCRLDSMLVIVMHTLTKPNLGIVN